MRHAALGLLLCIAFAACGETSGDDGTATGGSGGSSGGAAGKSGSGGVPASGGGAGGGAGGVAGLSGNAGSSGSAGTAGSACQDGGVVDAGSPEATIAAACVVAIVKVTRLDEECSGAGGTHVTLDVIEIGRGSGVTRVSHGGHAFWPTPDGPDQVGDVFVAGINPYGMLVDRPDNPGWCLMGLPAVDGEAHTLLAAANEAEAKTKMTEILSL